MSPRHSSKFAFARRLNPLLHAGIADDFRRCVGARWVREVRRFGGEVWKGGGEVDWWAGRTEWGMGGAMMCCWGKFGIERGFMKDGEGMNIGL